MGKGSILTTRQKLIKYFTLSLSLVMYIGFMLPFLFDHTAPCSSVALISTFYNSVFLATSALLIANGIKKDVYPQHYYFTMPITKKQVLTNTFFGILFDKFAYLSASIMILILSISDLAYTQKIVMIILHISSLLSYSLVLATITNIDYRNIRMRKYYVGIFIFPIILMSYVFPLSNYLHNLIYYYAIIQIIIALIISAIYYRKAKKWVLE